MLVFTRRVGEEVVIDGCVRVVVSQVNGEKVRLAVAAPESVRVDRGEVHQRRLGFAEAARAAASHGTSQGRSSEADLVRTAAHALRCSGHPPLWDLDCEAEDGRLVVRGQVPSYYLKQLVQTILMDQGAPRVENLVEVGVAPSPIVR